MIPFIRGSLLYQTGVGVCLEIGDDTLIMAGEDNFLQTGGCNMH